MSEKGDCPPILKGTVPFFGPDVLKEQGSAFREVLGTPGLFLVGRRGQLQCCDEAAVRLVEDLDIGFARPFEDNQRDRNWFQCRRCGRASSAFRRWSELFAVSERYVRKAELARLGVVLDEVNALAQRRFVLRRQGVGDRFAPR